MRSPLLIALGVGLLLPLLYGCGGSSDRSGKSSTDANKPMESVPKPPKPDPG
jgi:hypothetical protein